MTDLPDILRFQHRGNAELPRLPDVGWNGPWPPPETFAVAIGNQTGQVHVINDEPESIEKALTVARVFKFERKMYSKLDKGSSLLGVAAVRGAEYELLHEVTS